MEIHLSVWFIFPDKKQAKGAQMPGGHRHTCGVQGAGSLGWEAPPIL